MGDVAIDELADLEERYGAETLTVQAFAELVGADGASLRMRRQRSSQFVPPAETTSRAVLYRLQDLLAWAGRPRSSDGQPNLELIPQALRIREWAIQRCVERCARHYGPESTRMLVAGIALVRCDPDLGPNLDPAHHGVTGLFAALWDRVEASLGDTSSTEDSSLGFTPDPPPSRDARVVVALLRGEIPTSFDLTSAPNSDIADVSTGPISIERTSPEADLLVDEIWRLWQTAQRVAGTDTAPSAEFLRIVDEALASLSISSLELTYGTSPVLARLLVEVAAPRPGQVLLDPACGDGDVLIAAADRTAGRTGQTIALIGRDLEPRAWVICKARLGMRGLAHQLGQPVDSLEDDEQLGRFDRVVVEPGSSLWAAHRWLARTVALLGPEGVGVVELPIQTLGRDGRGRRVDRPVEREAAAAQGHVLAVITTPRKVRPESADPVAIWVLTPEPPSRGILLIDLREPSREKSGAEPLTSEQIAFAGELIHAHRLNRPLDANNAAPGVRFAVVADPHRNGTPDYWPAEWIRDEPGSDPREAQAEALQLTRRLRELVDDDASPDAVLHATASEEARRALRRLEKALLASTPADGTTRRPR